VGVRGLEPEAYSPQKTPVLKQRDAEYDALLADDERLRVLLEAWPDLPDTVKDAIRALVLRSLGEAE
jgi:hypothetical protein